MLRRFFISHWLIRLVVVMLVVALASHSVYADVASTTDNPAGYLSVDGTTTSRSLTFTIADFPAGSSINDVNIDIRFLKTDGSCTSPGSGTPYDNEILFRLTSPGGTNVTLINYGTFRTNSTSAGVVTTTFDDAASAAPAGAPATGTFLPTGPGGMNDFDGEDPLGTWTLTAGDSAGADPLCYDWSTLTIDADAPSPSLSLGKSVDVADPLPGQGIIYSVVVFNSGTGDATNAVVSDTLPGGLTFAGPVTLDPPGAGTTGTPPTLVSGLTIAAGERITLTFPVTVNTGLAAGTMITNTASVTSTEVATPLAGSTRLTVQNAAPVADDDPLVVQEDSSDNALDVLDGDSDANGDTLSIDAVGATDQGGTALNGGSVVTYTPVSDFFGAEVFTYTVSDGNGAYATATVTVTVQNQNDPPTADDDAFDVDEDSVDNALGVLVGDDDIDGDILSIDAVGATDQGGTALNGGSVVTYTPASDFFGAEVFTYTVSDGNGAYATATVNVTVRNQNDPPTADDDAFDVDEDSVNNALGVLVGDDDVDGDTLSIDAVGATDQGGTALNGGSVVTYTPASDFFGAEVFTYTVSDGNGGYATATVTVTVQNQNDPPTADDDTFDVDEDSVDNALGVLVGDDDVDGDMLSIDAVGATDQGGTALNGGSVVTYTPASNFHGAEVFTYTVSDGNGGYATATVTVTVRNRNDPPSADDDAYATPFETALVVLTATGVLTNDLDLDGDLLTATLGLGPSHGSLDLHPDGSFTYTPTATFFGTDAFTYHANDGLVDSNVATATITVLAPTEVDLALSKDVNEAVPGEGETIVYSLRVSNNGLITASGVAVSESLPAGVTFVGDDSGGTLVGGMWNVGSLSAGASATLHITATVNVGTGGTTITNTASIAAVDQNDPFPNNDSADAVIQVNSAPTISDIPDQRIHIGTALGPLGFTIGDHETDADNLWLWASSSNTTLVPTSAVVLGGSGTSRNVSISPTVGQTGTATIRITVSDGDLSAADNFDFTVEWYTMYLPFAKR